METAQNVLTRPEGKASELIAPREKPLEELVRNVSSRLNFDAIINYYDRNFPEYYTIARCAADLFKLRRLEVSSIQGALDSYSSDRLDLSERDLQAVLGKWEEMGFLKEEGNPGYQLKTEFGEELAGERLSLLKDLKKLRLAYYDHIRRLINYRYGADSYPYDPSGLSELEGILAIENNVSFDDDVSRIDFDPRFIEAMERFVVSKKAEFESNGVFASEQDIARAFYERAGSLNIEFAIENLAIEGLGEREGKIAVIKREDVIQLIRNNLPAYFLTRLKSITFKDKPKGLKEDDPGAPVAAYYFPDGKIEVYESPFLDYGVGEESWRDAKESIFHTIRHEIAHNAYKVVAEGDKARWTELVSRDKTSVSWYVDYCKRQHNGNKIVTVEDFCESMHVFLSDPALVFALSTPRWFFMDGLFRKYMQPEDYSRFSASIVKLRKERFDEWKAKGYKKEDVVKKYGTFKEEKDE